MARAEARTILEGDLAGTGNSESVEIAGKFNVAFFGTWVGTAVLKRSIDDGTTWLAASASRTSNDSFVCDEPSIGTLYRVDFTRTSGTLEFLVKQ